MPQQRGRKGSLEAFWGKGGTLMRTFELLWGSGGKSEEAEVVSWEILGSFRRRGLQERAERLHRSRLAVPTSPGTAVPTPAARERRDPGRAGTGCDRFVHAPRAWGGPPGHDRGHDRGHGHGHATATRGLPRPPRLPPAPAPRPPPSPSPGAQRCSPIVRSPEPGCAALRPGKGRSRAGRSGGGAWEPLTAASQRSHPSRHRRRRRRRLPPWLRRRHLTTEVTQRPRLRARAAAPPTPRRDPPPPGLRQPRRGRRLGRHLYKGRKRSGKRPQSPSRIGSRGAAGEFSQAIGGW